VLVLLELVVRVGITPLLPADDDDVRDAVPAARESSFWTAVLQTLEGWALGLAVAAPGRDEGAAGVRPPAPHVYRAIKGSAGGNGNGAARTAAPEAGSQRVA
jgi:hypothetical protein